jgi:hypothetical protein
LLPDYHDKHAWKKISKLQFEQFEAENAKYGKPSKGPHDV